MTEPVPRHEEQSGPQRLVALLPTPIVGWEDVLRAADPGREPTRARLRTLKQNGLLSEGVKAPRRESGRFSGSGTYYSVLWGWAERLRAEGLGLDALRLAQDALAVEGTFGRRLTPFLSHSSLDDLAAVDFFDELARSTAAGLARSQGVRDLVLAAGAVVEVKASIARIFGTSPAQEDTEVDLPARLVEQLGMRVGHTVWVVSRVICGAAVVEVLPAIWASVNQSDSAWFTWAATPTWVVEPSEAADEILQEAGAERYERTAAAMPDQAYMAGLLSDLQAGRLIRRRLRPAG